MVSGGLTGLGTGEPGAFGCSSLSVAPGRCQPSAVEQTRPDLSFPPARPAAGLSEEEGGVPGLSCPHPRCRLCCRSSRSPSRSWCSRRRAAARTACSTPVRRAQGGGSLSGDGDVGGRGKFGGWLLGTDSRAAEVDGKMYFCSQGRSRTPGSSWTPGQERSRPLSRQRPGMVCARQAPSSTSAAPVSQSRSPFVPPVPGTGRWAVTPCPAPVPRVRHHHV